MSIVFSSSQFPASNQTKDESGLPWGALITPLAPLSQEDKRTERKASTVARCSQCFGYVNSYCKFQAKYTWRCSLCYATNTVPPEYEAHVRGDDHQSERRFPELSANCVEFVVAENDGLKEQLTVSEGARDDTDAAVLEFPSYVFLVDLSSNQTAYIDLVKSALQAALEGLSSMCWVGLVVFSTRLGVYDLRSHIPHVRYCRLPSTASADGSLAELAGTLDSFLVRLDQHKDNIALAIESLASHAKGASTHRGFGGALHSVVSYLSSEPLNGRLLMFLAGRPDYGLGALEIRKQPEDLAPQTPFYRREAETAAKAGLGIDLFIISSMSYVDLASLKHLTLLTGGTMMLYEMAEDCSLPQDLYRQLSTPHVFRGLLRVRTSSEFQVSSVYGHLRADPQFERLFHLGVCSQKKTFACDFEFTSTAGFANQHACKPLIQMAFAYTQLEEVTNSGNNNNSNSSSSSSSSSNSGSSTSSGGGNSSGSCSSGSGNSGPKRWRMVRRLRICSLQASVSPSFRAMYQSVRPDVVLTLLTQQLIQLTLEKGVNEARTAVQDWLITLLGCFHEHVLGYQEGTNKGTLDLEFSEVDRMQFMPRNVFALLKHKFLAKDSNPDQRVFLHCLFSSLPPSSLAKCIYPNMTAFSTPDEGSSELLYLDSNSLIDGNIFLLDGFVLVLVYYTKKALEADFPFPPPHNSMIRAYANRLKADNSLFAPRVQYLREGESGERLFHQCMLEDKAIMGFSFADFLAVLDVELRAELKRRGK